MVWSHSKSSGVEMTILHDPVKGKQEEINRTKRGKTIKEMTGMDEQTK